MAKQQAGGGRGPAPLDLPPAQHVQLFSLATLNCGNKKRDFLRFPIVCKELN